MAKGFLGLEISDKLIRYVYLEKNGNSQRVLRAGKSAFKADLSAQGVLSGLIEGIFQENSIAPERIFLTISRRETVVHQVVLPKMSPRELEAVVIGEVEKIPDFANRNFEYIYRVYKHSKEKDKITFAAVSQSFLKNIIQEVQKTEVICYDLEIAPLNLKEILPVASNGKQCHVQLIVNNQHSFFTIFDNHQYRLFYKSSTGSDQFSGNLTEAGREQSLSQWLGELKRVLKSYLMENRGTQINHLYLIWDREVVPDLDKRVEAELALKVEVPSLNNIKGILIEEPAYLNPIYILALTPIIYQAQKSPAQFPLDHFFKSFQIKKCLMQTSLVAAVFLCLVGLAYFLIHRDMEHKKNAELAEASHITQQIENENREAQKLFEKRDQYLSVRQRLLDQASYVQQLNRVSWSQVLAVFANELPENLALTSFRFTESGRAQIQGDALSMDSIAGLIRRIETSAILENGNFDFLTEKKIEEQKLFSFGILAKLKDFKDTQP